MTTLGKINEKKNNKQYLFNAINQWQKEMQKIRCCQLLQNTENLLMARCCFAEDG